MIRTAYKLVHESELRAPFIRKVEITDLDGVSWREVKKQLRQFYLNEAANVRLIREKDYFAIPAGLVTEVDLVPFDEGSAVY